MAARAHAPKHHDLELRERIAAKHPGAIIEFHRRYERQLLTFARILVGWNEADAEDLVGDTIVAAILAIGSFDGRVPLETWLRGIARKGHLLRLRRQQPSRIEDADPGQEALLLDFRPTAEMERAETARHVRSTLAGLPRGQEEILRLHHLQGRSVAELAGKLGLSEGYLKVALHRARCEFRREWAAGSRKRPAQR